MLLQGNYLFSCSCLRGQFDIDFDLFAISPLQFLHPLRWV